MLFDFLFVNYYNEVMGKGVVWCGGEGDVSFKRRFLGFSKVANKGDIGRERMRGNISFKGDFF